MMPTHALRLRTFAFLAFLVCLIAGTAHAAPIDVETAQQAAARYLKTQSKLKAEAVPTLCLSNKASYLFQSGEQFALIAADDRLPSLLGIGGMKQGRVPEALRSLLTDYERLLAFLPEGQNVERRAYAGPVIAPLLTTLHGQSAPYNQFCPRYKAAGSDEAGELSEAGCVATALESVLTYYRRTYTLRQPLAGWETDNFTIADIPAGESVNTANIRDKYAPAELAEATDCARLIYWIGVAVKMKYGVGSSGATTRDAIEPLTSAFGLGYVHWADSYKYAPEAWIPMLNNELQARRPVYYAAHTMRLNGHAFVIDGINADGLYHVNWGYDGDLNGYFDLAILYAAEPYYDTTEEGALQGFFCNHEALFLHPDKQDVALPDTLKRTGEELVCTGWELLEAPECGEYTPMHLTLRNMADHRLFTPLELFTNLPADTALFAQGDYIALLQADLNAGEEYTYLVHLRFDESGDRILRLSCDDEHYQTLGNVSIAPHSQAPLRFDRPTLSFPDATTMQTAVHYENTSAVNRSGKIVTYELERTDSDDPHTVRHAYYRYLSPLASRTDEVTFKGLEPGARYRLQVRCPWTVVQTLYFVQGEGEVSSLNASPSYNIYIVSPAYDLSGRRVKNTAAKGFFIQNGRKQLRK